MQKLLKFCKERLEDSKLRRFYSIRDLLGSDGLGIKHFYLLQIREEIEILLVNGPLRVLGDILKRDDRFIWRREGYLFPLAIIGKDQVLHYNEIVSSCDWFKIYQDLLTLISTTPSLGLQVYTLMGLSLPFACIFSTHSPRSSSPTSREEPRGAEMMIMDLLESFLFMVLQILTQSSWVM